MLVARFVTAMKVVGSGVLIDRREFFRRAGTLGAGALAMANGLIPQYANAQTIAPNDQRIKGEKVTYPSPGGNSGQMGGYLVMPAG